MGSSGERLPDLPTPQQPAGNSARREAPAAGRIRVTQADRDLRNQDGARGATGRCGWRPASHSGQLPDYSEHPPESLHPHDPRNVADREVLGSLPGPRLRIAHSPEWALCTSPLRTTGGLNDVLGR